MHRWLWRIAVMAGLLAAPSLAHAQAAVGLRAGLRSAQLTTAQDVDGINDFVVGGYFGFGVSNRLALQLEAVYGTRGAKGLGLGDGELDAGAGPVDLEMSYLELPVLLRAGFPGERFLPSVFAGPYAAFLLSCEITPTDGASRDCETSGATERFHPRGTEFGILAGIGFDMAVGESTVFLDARYTLGLLSIESGDGAFDARHNGFAVTGGFAVPVGR
jgi:hypothetical protein